MTNGFIAIYTALLYYCCLVLTAKYIFSYQLRKVVFPIPFLVYILLFGLSFSNDTFLIAPISVSLIFAQFLFLKISFVKLKLRNLILSYAFIYCLCLISTSTITALFPNNYRYLDAVVTSICAVTCVLICVTNARHHIQRIIEWTPKYVLIISAVLLVIAAVTSTLISGFQQFLFPEVWNRFLQIFISFLLLAICTVVPVIFVISISNTRLKSLTADYEQQIRAQAAHYKELAEANYETRRFRHDFNNMRIALEQLYAQGEYEKAMELLRRQGEEMNACRPRFDTGNGIADALLTDKQAKAAQCRVVFEGVIPPDSPEPTDLCVILGNTLDNAIEACRKLPPETDRTVSVSADCCCGFLILEIRNPVSGPVEIRGGRISTTKDNKTLHGFGLYSLNTVVRKYDGTVSLSAEDGVFTARIELLLHPAPKKKHPPRGGPRPPAIDN